MRLSKFRLAGFRSFQEPQEIEFDPHLTILAGRNNVGKTASLLALRLPIDGRPGIDQGARLDYLWTLTSEELLAAIRFDGEPQLFQPITDQVKLNSTQSLRVTISLPPNPAVLPEVAGNSGNNGNLGVLWVHEIDVIGTPIKAHLGRIRNQQPPTPSVWWTDDSAIPGGHARIVELIQLISQGIQQFFYLQPRRTGSQTMPFAPSIPPPGVAPDGSNLTNVIGSIYVNDRLGSFKALEDFTKAAFRDVDRIDVRVIGNQATIYLVFGGPSGLIVSLEHCGTGIEQMLVLATAVLTSPTPRIFLLDEPHAFLHPDAERSLIRFLKDHHQHQYVVATHSGVFLNSYPLSHARLVTLTEQGSHVSDVGHASQILDEVGLTAADLWSYDAILWVEGPSEQAVVERLLQDTEGEVAIRVAVMPDSVRSAARSLKTAEAFVNFCATVIATLIPIKVLAVFLFDADEKDGRLKQKITEATKRRARFLDVRELENLFLDPRALQDEIETRCAEVERAAPTIEQITADFDAILGDTGDPRLYRRPAPRPDAKAVVGSEVLQRLYWKWVMADYDKVADGTRLLEAVIRHAPVRLEPIRSLITDLTDLVKRQGAA